MIASNHGTIAVDKLKVAALILAGCAALNFATLYAVIVWKAFTASGSTWQGQALNVVIFGVYYGLRSAAFVAFAYAARRDRFALCVVAAGILLHTVSLGFRSTSCRLGRRQRVWDL